MRKDVLAPIVASGWRKWLERLALRWLEISRRRTYVSGDRLVDALGALQDRGDVEIVRAEDGQAVVLAATRWIRIVV